MMDLTGVQIETERLLLTPLSTDYAEAIFREFTHELTVYMYPRAAERIEETQEFISRSVANLRNGTDLTMAILDKATGEFLGCAGLHEIESARPELGIWVKIPAHGNRFGFEAVAGLVDWARRNTDCASLYYPVDERNIASRRIPERLGGAIIGNSTATSMSGRELRIVRYEVPLR